MDVTEIVLTQNELKISEQKYQNLFDTSPLPKWIYDLESFKILGVNKTAILQYGYSYEEFLSMTIFDIRPKAEIPKVKQGLQSLKNKRGIVRFGVFTHKRKDGSLILMELSGHRISFDGRKCMMIVGSDVTDRENTLRALEASEARYRGFYESQTNYVVRTDMKGNYTYANKKFIEDFAWIHGGKNIIGKNGMISICEYDHGKVEKIVEKCIQNPGKVVKVEIDKLHKKQGVVSTLWDFVCISNAEGVPREIQCMGIDISERINIEKQLKQSNERFEKISQATQDAIWDWDIVHNKLYWGEGYKTLFGYDILKEPSYAKWEECIHPDDFVQLKTELEKALTDKSVTKFKGDYRFKKADDTYAFVADKGIIVRDESGNPIRMLGAIIDITQRKENEALLQRLNHELEERAKALAVSNEELEQFAYIASHDLQEPLRMVTSFLGQLKKKYNHLLDEKAHTYIHFAVDGAARMRQIILDLLEFSRVGKHEDKKSTFSLTEIVDEICVLNQKIIQEKKAEIDFEKLPEITSFKTPVFQILQNLIGNSLKYSKDNVPPIIKIKAKKHQDSYLISVNDNGIGIEEAYFEKIFVIFQRLHNQESYSGTGMGLAIVKKIVDNLGGKVWLESINGVGSTFYIQLPK